MASSFHIDSISAVILAGGRGSRMAGRDKGLLTLENRPLIETVLRQISTQIPSVMISANRNLDHYREYDVPVIPDSLEDFQGPLAGIAAALAYTDSPLLLTLPVDAPAVPHNLASRLLSALLDSPATIAVAHDGTRRQSVYQLMDVGCRDDLIKFLKSGQRRVESWLDSQNAVAVDFSDQRACFHNFNRPEDMAAQRQE